MAIGRVSVARRSARYDFAADISATLKNAWPVTLQARVIAGWKSEFKHQFY